MEKIVVITLPILHFFLEGFHDYYVWKSSDANEYRYTKMWHKTDFFIKLWLYVVFSYLAFDIWQMMLLYLIYVGCCRVVFLNGVFNYLRGDSLHYFSADSNNIDKFLGKTPKLSYYGITLLFLVLSFLIYFLNE